MSKNFSLITYNIHKGFSIGRVRFLLPKMREALTALNPDFIFLQEVQGAHRGREKRINNWPDLPQFAYLAEDVWPYYYYAKNAIYQSGHHGNAILSKYPFTLCENINLSAINRASRSILHGQIKLSAKKSLHLLCIHLGLFKSERKVQCQALIERILAVVPADEPLIMAGDFNDWRHQLSRPLAEIGINEAFYTLEGQHARSFPAIKPTLCVDRIYFRAIELLKVEKLDSKPWHLLSDHIPLYAQFKV